MKKLSDFDVATDDFLEFIRHRILDKGLKNSLRG